MRDDNTLRRSKNSLSNSGSLPPVMHRLERRGGAVDKRPRANFRVPLNLVIGVFFVAALIWAKPWDKIGSIITDKPELEVAQVQLHPQGLLPVVKPHTSSRITHEVRSGETWGSIVNRYGFETLDGHKLDDALRSFAKKEPFAGVLRIGQEISFKVSHDGQLEEVALAPRTGTMVTLTKSVDEDAFIPSKTEMARISLEQVGTGEITRNASSFAVAAKEAGVNYDIVDDLVDVFSDRINFRRDFRLGDSFSVIFDERRLADGTLVKSGPVVAAVIEVGGKPFYAVRHVGSDGEARYFDEEGKHIANTFLRYPVKFSRISSNFSRARFHPVLKRYRPHNGVDFAAPTGTTVRSVADGVVTFAGRKGPAGRMVKIKHSHRYSTAYLHLSRIAGGVRKGTRIKRGEKIGAVGMTGRATGPHLHYSFYDRGRYVDPMKIKLPRVQNLNSKQRISKEKLRKALSLLEHYRETSGKIMAQAPTNSQAAKEQT